jgi:hypothetical protein
MGLKEAVAEVYLLEWHQLGQRPFASLLSFRQTIAGIINHCQDWFAEN